MNKNKIHTYITNKLGEEFMQFIKYINNNSDDPDKPWGWEYVSYNPNLTMEFLSDNLDKPWYWYRIYRNDLNYKQRYVLEVR